jgi:hypothetical protein
VTFVVLGVLAIVWVVVLGSYARERMADRRTDSVSAFHSQLSTLQRTNAARDPLSRHGVGGFTQRTNAGSAVARQRRKNVLLGLLTAGLLTVLAAWAAPGIVTIGLAMICVAAFTGYVLLLVERQRVLTERRAKVRPIAAARPRPVMRQAAARQTVLSASRR